MAAPWQAAHTVDLHLAVSNHLLDLPLLLEVLQTFPRQRAIDLESVNEGRDGNKAVGLHVLVQLVGGGLVEKDGVLSLILDCTDRSQYWQISTQAQGPSAGLRAAHPFPWTTSSSASSHQLPREPFWTILVKWCDGGGMISAKGGEQVFWPSPLQLPA
jgi:hypothetical protein